MQKVASGVDELGARLTFTFWAEQGALTLLSHQASAGHERMGTSAGGQDLGRILRVILAKYARQHTGVVEVRLRREESRWTVEYDATQHFSRPFEAKTLPVRWEGASKETVEALSQGAKAWQRSVQVPRGGAVRVEWEVHMEDGRLKEWALRKLQRTREGSAKDSLPLSPQAVGALSQRLLPFTEGLGTRTVHLVLQAEHSPGEEEIRGLVESVRVERPESAPGTHWYLAMHEAILRRWREGVSDGAEWLAQKGVEELALWYAGGMLQRGVGLLVPETLRVMKVALGRGEAAAAGWLRTSLKRLPPGDRRAFERLWRKVHLEGEKALSQGERNALRGLMEDLERLVQTPLHGEEKGPLREAARNYYKQLHPAFEELMDAEPFRYPVHHRRPLEHAHLFPAEDINAAENLIMVRDYVHGRINALWTMVRTARPGVTAQEVDEVARIIDRHFENWYDRIDLPESAPPGIQEAEAAALQELQKLFPGLK
jgi:hypothetical protein